MKPNHLKPITGALFEQPSAVPQTESFVWVFDPEATGECCPAISALEDGSYRVVDANSVEPGAMPAQPVADYADAFEKALACRRDYLERAAHELCEHRNWVFGCEPRPVH